MRTTRRAVEAAVVRGGRRRLGRRPGRVLLVDRLTGGWVTGGGPTGPAALHPADDHGDDVADEQQHRAR